LLSERPSVLLYSPGFNLTEKAFSRLKAMPRKALERIIRGLWDLTGRLVDIFQPDGCPSANDWTLNRGLANFGRWKEFCNTLLASSPPSKAV
jgi:hypothetical protein